MSTFTAPYHTGFPFGVVIAARKEGDHNMLFWCMDRTHGKQYWSYGHGELFILELDQALNHLSAMETDPKKFLKDIDGDYKFVLVHPTMVTYQEVDLPHRYKQWKSAMEKLTPEDRSILNVPSTYRA